MQAKRLFRVYRCSLYSAHEVAATATAAVGVTAKGTEFGLADAHGGDAQSYAAPWMQQTRSLLIEGSLPPSRQEYLMPNALASAGVCHCFDNLEKDLDRQLSFWPRCIVGFKLLCGLFTKVHLLEFFRRGLP